jgi:putative oxidoreductase
MPTGEIDRSRLIIPALAPLYEAIAPYSYALIRFVAGAWIVYHGYMKLFGNFAEPVAKNVIAPLGFPAPLAWAYFLGVLELFGGIALALGLLTRPLALLFFIQFLFITYWHSGNGYFFTAARGGWEFPAIMLVIYFAIFFRGAGRCSIDKMIGKEF